MVALKDQPRAIGRPGRPVISEARRERGVCQLHGVAAISLHDPERRHRRVAVGALRTVPLTVGNRTPIRRPGRHAHPQTRRLHTVGELHEARPIGVHQKDVATATILPALCEDDGGAVGRPGGPSVFFPVDRVRELAHIAAISVGREDRGRGLVMIQKALPGDAAQVSVGGCGGRRSRLLHGCRLPTGYQQRGQQADHEERWKTSSHRCFPFLWLSTKKSHNFLSALQAIFSAERWFMSHCYRNPCLSFGFTSVKTGRMG